MELALAALPGVITSCALAYVLLRVLERQSEERAQVRVGVEALNTSHTEQVAKLLEAHRREVANLCQRIQAPQIAVQEHAGRYAGPDPVQVDLEDDEVLAEIRRREDEMFRLAEELAAER